MGMLASLLAGLASGETAAAVQRARRAAIAYLIASIFGICGVGFLIGAGTIWLARRYGAIEAATAIGVGFLVVAVLVMIIHKITSRVRARRAASHRGSELTAVAIASGLAILPTLLRGRAGLGTIIAPVVAMAAYAIYKENTKPPLTPGSDPE